MTQADWDEIEAEVVSRLSCLQTGARQSLESENAAEMRGLLLPLHQIKQVRITADQIKGRVSAARAPVNLRHKRVGVIES